MKKEDIFDDTLISRQAVKEQMIKYGFLAPDMTVTEFVEDLPSVSTEKTERWIPVSERLPEDSGEYLVSVIDGLYGIGDYKATGIGWFAHKKDYDIEESEWRELGIGEKVVAWMPLPQPYKGESEG